MPQSSTHRSQKFKQNRKSTHRRIDLQVPVDLYKTIRLAQLESGHSSLQSFLTTILSQTLTTDKINVPGNATTQPEQTND